MNFAVCADQHLVTNSNWLARFAAGSVPCAPRTGCTLLFKGTATPSRQPAVAPESTIRSTVGRNPSNLPPRIRPLREQRFAPPPRRSPALPLDKFRYRAAHPAFLAPNRAVRAFGQSIKSQLLPLIHLKPRLQTQSGQFCCGALSTGARGETRPRAASESVG